jgi:hypothetical protein
MKTITITYDDGKWAASADPPITLEDQIILFSNTARRACLVVFESAAAFGIKGIVVAPESGFTLVFRGVATEFQLSTVLDSPDTHNPTIPPGSLFRRK